MKRLASIILQKRNEVETFLLDSIELVKAEISRRRAEEERSMPRPRGNRLPALGSAGKISNLPSSAEEHIDIRDLTWEDRERVLRLLFAKINNAAPFPQMPAHALHDDGFDGLGVGPPMSNESGEPPMSADTAFFVTQAEQA